MSTRAACARGARSPEAPSEPISGTAGVMPAFNSSAMTSRASVRAPLLPAARVPARSSCIAADHLAFDERAHARRMAVHECLLDAHGFVRGDPVAREGTESGRHAVDGAALCRWRSSTTAREGAMLCTDVVGDLDVRAVSGDVDDLFDRQGLWPEPHVRDRRGARSLVVITQAGRRQLSTGRGVSRPDPTTRSDRCSASLRAGYP